MLFASLPLSVMLRSGPCWHTFLDILLSPKDRRSPAHRENVRVQRGFSTDHTGVYNKSKIAGADADAEAVHSTDC